MIELIYLLLFIIICYILGKRFIDKIVLRGISQGERFLFSVGFGLGILSFIVFLLGSVGLLYKWVILCMIGILAIFGSSSIKLHPFSSTVFINKIKGVKILSFPLLLSLILLCFMFINLIGALVPPTGFDPLAYHLLTPKRFLARHSMYPLADSSQSYSPMAIEMLYVVAVSLGKPIFANLIHLFLGIAVVLTILSFSHKFMAKNGTLAILAATIFYTQPVIGHLSIQPKIDLGLTFYFMLVVFAFFNWCYQPRGMDKKWLVVSAICLGLTASSKLTGVILFPMFFIGILLKYYFEKDIPWNIAFRTAFFYTGIGILIVSAWYIRTFLWTGDPIFPYLSEMGSVVSPMKHAHKVTFYQYIMLPWDLAFNINKFLYGNNPMAPYFLAFLPLLFMIKKNDKVAQVLLAISVLYITFFFFTDITMRYILPALALLSIVYAFLIVRFIEKMDKNARIIMRSIALLPFFISFMLAWEDGRSKIPVVFGLEKQESYLSMQMPGLYDVCVYINSSVPSDAKIFAPWEVRGYYINREFVTGNSRFGRNFERIKTCRALIEKVKLMGFTHILLNMDYHNQLIEMYKKGQIKIDPDRDLFHDPRMKQYLEEIYSRKNVYLYKIKNKS